MRGFLSVFGNILDIEQKANLDKKIIDERLNGGYKNG